MITPFRLMSMTRLTVFIRQPLRPSGMGHASLASDETQVVQLLDSPPNGNLPSGAAANAAGDCGAAGAVSEHLYHSDTIFDFDYNCCETADGSTRRYSLTDEEHCIVDRIWLLLASGNILQTHFIAAELSGDTEVCLVFTHDD